MLYWLIETISKGEVEECGWQTIHFAVEIVPISEIGERRRECSHFLVGEVCKN